MAMAAATRAGVPRFLTALAVANGANAGNLSPISAIGIIANTKMAEAGLGGHEAKVWIANFVAHVLVMAGRLRAPRRLAARPASAGTAADAAPRFEPRHWLTVAVIGAWIAGVIAFQLNVGLAAFLAASLLVLMAIADETAAMQARPVERDRDGLRRHRADLRAGEDRRHGAVHRDAGAPGNARHAERHGGLRDRADLELEQHERRRAAHLPADGAGPRRRRSAAGIRSPSP